MSHQKKWSAGLQQGPSDGARRKPANQEWAVGRVVNVGFMKLQITEKTAFGWLLCGIGNKAERRYEFIPQKGIKELN